MEYDDREITGADVWGVQVHREADGGTRISGSVRIRIAALNGSPNGPFATVELAADSKDPEPTIRGAERDLVEAAVLILGRLAKSSPDHLHALIAKMRDDEAVTQNHFLPKS